jgi:surfeit locus 1 family protein
LATDPDTRYFELGSAAPQGRVWQNLNFKRYAAWSGLNLQPFVLQQSNDGGDGLIRDWPRPDTGVATHLSYAMQWYGLAATLIVLWLVLNVKRKRTDGTSN